MSLSILLSLCCMLFFGCGPDQSGSAPASADDTATTTFILVRHAEKGAGEDPDLTPEGTARAARLRDRLADRSISQVYTTDFKRTRQTAGPTAEQQGVEPTVYQADQLQQFARTLQERHAGETVLVVGHSNTTPALANILTDSDEWSAFDESDYGNLLIVTVPPTGSARVEQLRY